MNPNLIKLARPMAPAWPTVDENPPGDEAGGGAPPATSEGEAAPAVTSEDVAKLQRALTAERQRSREIEKQLKAVDPKLLEEARRKADEAEAQRQLVEESAQLKVREAQRQQEEAIGRIRSEADAAVRQAKRDALRLKVQSDFLASDGLAEASEIDGRTPFDYVWSTHGDLIAEDETGPYVVGEGGLPRTDPESGKRLTLREFFGKLRDDPVHGMNFKPRYGTGGGSRAGYTGRVGKAADLANMSTKDLLSAGLKEAREHQRRTA